MQSDRDRLVDILRICISMGRTYGAVDWVINITLDRLRAFLNIIFDESGDITSICGKEL